MTFQKFSINVSCFVFLSGQMPETHLHTDTTLQGLEKHFHTAKIGDAQAVAPGTGVERRDGGWHVHPLAVTAECSATTIYQCGGCWQ